MRSIFVILGVIFILDLLCLIFTIRLTRGRWRWLAVAFVLAQIAGFAWLMASRFSESVPSPPVSALSMVYVWHLIGLAAFLVVALVVCVAGIVMWLRDRFRKSQPDPEIGDASSGMSRREFLGAAAAFAPPLMVTGLTATALAHLDFFRVRRMDVALPQLPPALDGLTIAHVSDMHVGKFTTGPVLRQMAKATNDLNADLVLLTGDLINHALADLPEAIDTVRAMKGRYGVWTIEGNHDLIEDGREFERRMRASGLNFLLNESAALEIRGEQVQLLGLPWVRRRSDDYEGALARAVQTLLLQRNPSAFPILLAHHPHAFDTAADHEVPLTLAGHTHGGQLMLNDSVGFGPAMFRYWSGLYERGDSRIVVSNGVGNWFPLRINAPAEILHLTLRKV